MAQTQKITVEQVRDIVFAPNDAVKAAIKTIEQRRSYTGAGVRTGIPVLDNYMIPARPGELITVMGMSSNYKSGFMQYWARHTAEEIMSEGLDNECVVYVTWEQSIEEMLAFDLAFTARLSATDVVQGKVSDEELERLRSDVGSRRAVTPVYLIGHSVQEEKRRPRMQLTAVGQALEYIKGEFGVRPRAIFLDYLQRISAEQGEDRRMQVFHIVDRCKDMSLAMGCPVILGCQAGRQVYGEKWGVPGMADGLECSNIEHSTDKMYGLWMPKTSYEVGTRLDTKEQSLTVTENLLIVKVLKQKLGPAGRWFPLYVQPEKNEITEMDLRARR
jgi:replicative DNA helicase